MSASRCWLNRVARSGALGGFARVRGRLRVFTSYGEGDENSRELENSGLFLLLNFIRGTPIASDKNVADKLIYQFTTDTRQFLIGCGEVSAEVLMSTVLKIFPHNIITT